MDKKKKSSDANVIAFNILAEATREPSDKVEREKNPAAVALGRLGGLKGGKARAEKLSPEKRQEIARNAATKRWEKKP